LQGYSGYGPDVIHTFGSVLFSAYQVNPLSNGPLVRITPD